MMTDISRGIIAYLQGGLGNQLFIYAAAYEQAQRLNCELFIDISRYFGRDPLERGKKETSRQPELLDLGLPGTVINEESPWFKNSPRRPPMFRKIGSRSHRLQVFREKGFEYNPEINEVKKGTTLLGYFQSPYYFQQTAEELLDFLQSIPLAPKEKLFLANQQNNVRINAHIRRGDYLRASTAKFHGLTSTTYFENAFKLLHEKTGVSKIKVFTDSPKYVEQEFAAFPNLTFANDEGISSMAVMIALSHCAGLAMSNSSFSWWAAWLLTQRNPSAPIVAPIPWQASGESASDLLLDQWFTLPATA